ncbi:TniB family NTP-binding protein [Thioclava pacifica]|nr:TniB family NTP-binding protein [Thioclava pacifica]
MIMIDEVHNLLAGTHREQRRFLNVLRYLSNELEASLVCFWVIRLLAVRREAPSDPW